MSSSTEALAAPPAVGTAATTQGRLRGPASMQAAGWHRRAPAPAPGCLGFGLLLAAGCGDDGQCEGAEGCACFPNGTCLEDLSCASNFCVDLDGDPDGGRDAGSDQGSSGSASGSGGRGGPRGGAGADGGPAGAGGSDAGGTTEQGDACEASAECAALDDPCRTPVCVSGVCDSASRPEGSAVEDDSAGDCQRLLCDPEGEIASEIDPNDVPSDDDDPCTISACEGSNPTQTPAPQGTPTPASSQTDGDCLRVVCDGSGGLSSVFDDGDISADPPADPCKARECDQGAPTLVDVPPGTPCGSDLVCDATAACVACAGNGTSCTLSAQCCGGLCQGGTTCATCPQNMADCDGSTGTGCEASLNSVLDCGRCGRSCTGRPFVQSPTCSNGACAIYSCQGGHADVDGVFENGCEEIPSVGPGGAYAACTASDSCGVGEACGKASVVGLVILQFSPCSASTTGCYCAFPCAANADCPAAPGATAVPSCGANRCYLSCDASGSTCPAGMHCSESPFVPFPSRVCVSD